MKKIKISAALIMLLVVSIGVAQAADLKKNLMFRFYHDTSNNPPKPLSKEQQKLLTDECPDISQVKKVIMWHENRKNDEPITLYIPYGYLNSSGRTFNTASILSVNADYQTLEPLCSKYKSSTPMNQIDGMYLSLTKGKNAGNVIDFDLQQTKNRKIWRLINDDNNLSYDHYINIASKDMSRSSIFAPRKSELAAPHIIICDSRSLKVTTTCQLRTDYQNQFLVSIEFSSKHLDAIPQIYQKANTLINRFYSNAKKEK